METFHRHAQPFDYEGGEEGCLLIHGFTGTPAHMRLLGENLHKGGYTVKGILLKGHGTKMEDMEKVTWQDWLQDAITGYEALRKTCSKVYVMGLSMGGVLSLLLAEQYPVDKVIPIAAPIRIHDRKAHGAPLLKYFQRFRMWGGNEAPPVTEEFTAYKLGYDGFAVEALCHLLKLMKMAEKNLHQIHCPTLVVQSKTDETVKPVSAQIIYDRIKASQREILWLDHSKHVCTIGPEREVMHKKIHEFLREI